MEINIEKLQFPIGKYKANLEFDFSRTLEDMKILESFAEILKESIKDLNESDFKKTYSFISSHYNSIISRMITIKQEETAVVTNTKK